MPQQRDSELAPHAHRMVLWGSPSTLDFPPLCPNCGKAAANRISYAKVFERSSDSDTPVSHVVIPVAVPFCDDCIAHHRAQTPITSLVQTIGSSFATGDMFAALGFGAAALFTLRHALGELLPLRASHFAMFAVLTLAFGLLAWFQGRQAWAKTQHLRVVPQTAVTRAFDFSDVAAAPFESDRFSCTMRDERFATALRDLNRRREFDPHSPEAAADRRAARREFWTVGFFVAAIALFFLIRDLLK